MKRRVARDFEFKAKYGRDAHEMGGFPALIPDARIKREAKKRINRLERREAKQDSRSQK